MKHNALVLGVLTASISLFALSSCFFCSPCDGMRCSNLKSSVVADSLVQDSIVYDIYIENSGSMDGYVRGNTDFKNAVYNCLTDLKGGDMCKAINLNYINSQILPFNNGVRDFIQKLDPNTFRLRGGNRSSSDIAEIIKIILDENTEKKVSVFVSDCIFSPGSGNNAEDYLTNQQIGIRTAIKEKQKNRKDFMVTCYQLQSSFDGNYYDKNNSPTRLKGDRRPYYIWLFGERNSIIETTKYINKDFLSTHGLQNVMSFSSYIPKVSYKIVNTNKIGTFERCEHNTQKHIVNCEKATSGKNQGKFAFSIEADFSMIPVEKSYLEDSTNYIVSSKNYDLAVSCIKGKMYRITMILKPSVSSVPQESLTISLQNKKPAWVDQISETVGVWNQATSDKTFGFSYLADGVYQVYTPVNDEDDKVPIYATFKVIIN